MIQIHKFGFGDKDKMGQRWMGMKNIMLGGWDKSIELVSVVCSSMTFLEFQLLIPTSDFKSNVRSSWWGFVIGWRLIRNTRASSRERMGLDKFIASWKNWLPADDGETIASRYSKELGWDGKPWSMLQFLPSLISWIHLVEIRNSLPGRSMISLSNSRKRLTSSFRFTALEASSWRT